MPLEKLLEVIDTLLGPNGCPWDKEQTLLSMRADLLEEVYEVIDAIDIGDATHINEELGDLMFNVVFLCRLAEKEGVTSLEKVFEDISEKLIRRHPHVFGESQVANSQQVLDQWDKIKRGEKGKEHRKSALDGIPKGLPALSRAQKVLKKMQKAHFHPKIESDNTTDAEIALGNELITLVTKAQKSGVDAELALRNALAHHEKEFRDLGH